MTTSQPTKNHDFSIVWSRVIYVSLFHIVALYALTISHNFHMKTVLLGLVTYLVGGFGLAAGAHRLWSHRSYQAKLPLRIFLATGSCIAWQAPILYWCREHRTHHKCSETDGDPHNAKRGFFFSHLGCHLIKKHPDVIKNGKTVPLDDLLNDPVVIWQNKVFLPASILLCIVLPTLIPYLCWDENLWYSLCCSVLRYVISLHAGFSVNSFAHLYGDRPYDVTINPAENKIVSFFAMGEGFHNYHHTFPQDYRTSEFRFSLLNLNTLFIDLMAMIGQAYNRTTTPERIVEARQKRTGNLSLLNTESH
ncbi:stearoyl-CoA desaturase 5-like [Styela clava]